MKTETSWRGIVGIWFTTLSVYTTFLFTNIIFGVIVGAFTSWLLSITFIGAWVVDGLKILGVAVENESLYKLGAAAGFFAGFLKFKVEK
ncbi:MAG: hypothetical protein WC539_08675 [Nitrospirota bacterium]